MSNLILLNKPFNVLSQFTDPEGRQTLANFIEDKAFYAAGRLDYDSEGLILLTNNGQLQNQIANPKQKMPKTYIAQVEGQITQDAIKQLMNGVELKDGKTRPAKAAIIDQPNDLWDRVPPVRKRDNIPTSWIKLTITEGKNRQVRRMTANVGYPTLRLIRISIGPWSLDSLKPGEHKKLTINMPTPKQTSHHPKTKRKSKKI